MQISLKEVGFMVLHPKSFGSDMVMHQLGRLKIWYGLGPKQFKNF